MSPALAGRFLTIGPPGTSPPIISDTIISKEVFLDSFPSLGQLSGLWKLGRAHYSKGFPGGSEVKAPACNAGDLGSIPGSGRFPGEGNSNLLQYSCLENPMGGGAWWATVHGVAESRTRLSDFTFTFITLKSRARGSAELLR